MSSPKIVDDTRLNSLRRLVEQQHARPAAKRAGDREHLLFAAGKRAAALLQALRENRESSRRHLSGYLPCGLARSARVPIRRFSRTRELGEDAAALRHEGDALLARRDAAAGQQSTRRRESMLPLLGRSSPMIVRISVVLPTPFRPRRRQHLAPPQFQADPVEDRVEP